MTLARSLLCASAVGLAASAAFAGDYSTSRPGAPYGASAMQDPQLASVFSRLDIDRDGLVSSAEASAEPNLARVFARADADRSGALTPAEFQSAVVIASDAMPGVRGEQADRDPADALFSRYDANRDDMISPQEAQADPELMRWFAQADRDRSGSLTPEEFSGALSMAASEHRERMRRG